MSSPQEKEYWVVCPVCHKANPAGTKYCKYCWGAALGSQPLVATEDLEQVIAAAINKEKRRKLIIRLSIAGAAVVAVTLITLRVLFAYTDVLTPVNLDMNSNSSPGEWAMFRHDLRNTGVVGPTSVTPQGTLKWSFDTGGPIHSSAAIAGDTIYFGSQDGYLYALNAETGEERWRFKTGSFVNSSPAVVDGVVYVGSNDGNMYAVDAASGNEIWEFETPYPISSSPAVADGRVFFGADDYSVYALNAKDGSQIWKFNTLGPVGSSPVIVDGLLYVGSGVQYAYVLNASNGHPRLRFKMFDSTYGSVAIDGTTAYLGNFRGDLYAFNGEARNWPLEYELKPIWIQVWAFGLAPEPPVQSGFLWGTRLGRQPISNSAALSSSGDSLFLGSGVNLVAVDTVARKTLWSFPTGATIRSSPALLDSMIVVGSNDGHVYAVDRTTGEQIWDFKAGLAVGASPTVSNGVIFVGSDDGTLYAIE